ncbi:hypothetical protein ACFXG4_37080 [Nocardia sp. NPDC059246]|uniref:hypothetical protein n=1 Tax=unclassified Nocardia TaxID=2637762 RepID=UPI0036CFDCDA
MTMKTRSVLLAAAAGSALFLSTGIASADPTDPSGFLIGDTAFFNIGGFNCSIAANGIVGCDINPAGVLMYVSLAGPNGQAYPVPYAPAAIIDNAAWPAHPEWSGGGHTQPGGNQALPSSGNQALPSGGNQALPSSGDVWAPASISYAGATCTQGYRGGVQCSSMGHQFSFNSNQVYGS